MSLQKMPDEKRLQEVGRNHGLKGNPFSRMITDALENILLGKEGRKKKKEDEEKRQKEIDRFLYM